MKQCETPQREVSPPDTKQTVRTFSVTLAVVGFDQLDNTSK